MKTKTLAAALLLMGSIAGASADKTPQELRVYINPGHGSWTGNDRPIQLIGKPAYSATNTDTTGFFESNTDLEKGFGMLEKLIEMGMPFDRTLNQTGERWQIGAAKDLTQNIVMSRVKNGPFEANNTTSSANYMLYNRSLPEIAAEVEYNEFDIFVSIHSNAATIGSTVNYHLFMYRGRNGRENVLAPGSYEMAEAASKYSFINKHAAWSVSYPYINGDIDFMGSGSSSIGALGYEGYLGVLKHGCPGYLVEGYFHTYLPAAHRGMNFDVDRVEGMQYARGVAEYFNFDKRDASGEIYGIVRDEHERFSDPLYKPNPATDDIYKPLNGVTATLWQGEAKLAEYITDGMYNGAFVFTGLEPGKYTVTLSHPDYKDIDPIEVEVAAGETSYPSAFMEAADYEPPTDVAYNYPDPMAQLGSVAPASEYHVSPEYADVEIAQLQGKKVKRVIARDGKLFILALDKDIEYAANIPVADQAKATILVYDPAEQKVLAEVSTEGAAGAIAAISDIQVTAEGILLACNATKNQYDSSYVQDGDAGRGTFYIYKWENDENGVPTGVPSKWFSSQSSALWFRAYPTRFVYSGTMEQGKIVIPMPTITAPNYQARALFVSVLDGSTASTAELKPTATPLMMGTLAADFNMFPSPLSDDDAVMFDSNNGAHAWNMVSALDNTDNNDKLLAGIDGRLGMFKYAGASYIAAPAVENGNVAGVKLYNITNGLSNATETAVVYKSEVAPVETSEVATTGEVEVSRDAVTGAVTSGWINLYMVRDGKITKLTTKSVEQPQGRVEYAYGLKQDGSDENFIEISFQSTGAAPSAQLVCTPVDGKEVLTFDLGAVEAGENTYTLAKSELGEECAYKWAINIASNGIPQAGVYYKEASGLTNRGGVVPITDPEQESFGYVAVGHGFNNGIDIYNPAGEKVASRVFKGHSIFGDASNQSNPFRGNQRNGYVVFSTFGDQGHGMVAINPLDTDEEPFTLFAGTKSSSGCFIYDGVKLGGGNSGFDFITDAEGEDYVVYFSEDHENLNGKGETENALVKQHLSSPWQITEAPKVLGYQNLLANHNVDVYTYGDGVFVCQVREVENNSAGCPAFAYISDILGTPNVEMHGADESIKEYVPTTTAGQAITRDGKLLAISGRTSIVFFDVEWDGNTPKLSYKYSVPTESHIWANMHFDYAGNLHVYQREQGYRVITLPQANPQVSTPAPAESLLRGINSSVELTPAEAAAANARFYNLQGVEVNASNLTPGIYVQVKGAATSKVYIK